jgi:hypothetical protein
MWTSRLRVAALAFVLSLLAPAARAQSEDPPLGVQRVGTASGSFLRIGVGARAVGLGESFVAVANDPTAIFWNPAGLASQLRPAVELSHTEWPAEIRYEHVAWVLPVQRLGGSVAFQFGALTTDLDETTEYLPFGTGRTFTYSDIVAGAAYARRWTDKLLVGAGVKYVREDLGTGIDGPATSAVLVDVGSIFYLGLGSVRIATALSNFGSQLRPSGEFVSPFTGETRSYSGYDPPTVFRYGVAFEPIESETQRLTTSLEANQPADNRQLVKAGAEWTWNRSFALRGGYNFMADQLKLSAGAGFDLTFGETQGNIDYAWTDGGILGSVHRVSLGVRF